MMNIPTGEIPSGAVLVSNGVALQADIMLWHHGMNAFIRELDALVVTGRISPDARNVIFWTLKRVVPMVDHVGEGNPADE
jgi:hypothetical protein